ncbi:hypothetical protein L841_3129 [Mycobacterium sp. MAC_080597_8934]|nr:hypothetical protein L840_1865 [Mycobacterium sp. MAC_011194_8550]ETZ66884.1 hypothetical protein L841_3134 [Mycobacterium sp. MAC_080597_8934]ETZ67001.1 hypothetical protein L841_3129 [Mycobacterium sp. MAC_080597_8934]
MDFGLIERLVARIVVRVAAVVIELVVVCVVGLGVGFVVFVLGPNLSADAHKPAFIVIERSGSGHGRLLRGRACETLRRAWERPDAEA